MGFEYADILGLRRPVHKDDLFSRRHPKMAQRNRAKLFAPFAALTGFDGAVRAKEVQYVPRRILDSEEVERLNQVLNKLHEATRTGALARQNRIAVRVEYFEVCADINSEAYDVMGLYHTVAGIARRVDHENQMLHLLLLGDDGDCKAIPFSDISAIMGV